MHEQPGGYGREPYPNQPHGQGPGGVPPQPPQPPGQPPYGGPPGQPSPYGPQPPYGAPQQPAGPWGGPQPGGWEPQDAMGSGGGWGPRDPMGPGGWGPPPGPPRKGNSGPVIAVVGVAALVLLGGGGAIVWALSGNDHTPSRPVAVSTPPASVPSFPDPTGLPSTFPSPSLPSFPTPSGSPTLDESMFVQAGDCVRITGKAPDLKMFKTDCDGAPYKVLKRFSGTSDKNKCRNVPGYTTAFWAKSQKYSFLSYVICLKHQ